MRQHLFDRDLRYVIKPRYAARASALGSHSHWIVSILIAVAVAIWLGRAPDASIDRVQPDADDTAVLKAQIASVLVAEPPISKAPTTSVQTLPSPAGMQGLAALSIPAKQTIHATETVPAGPSTPAVGDTARVALAPPRDSLTAMIPAAPAPHWQTVEIRKGDSLTRVFKQLRLDPRRAIIIANKPGARALKNLRIGPHLKVRISDDKLVALQYQQNLTTLLRVEATGDDYSIDTVKRQFDITEREITGLITDSLYRSALRAGLSDQFTYSLASIFNGKLISPPIFARVTASLWSLRKNHLMAKKPAKEPFSPPSLWFRAITTGPCARPVKTGPAPTLRPMAPACAGSFCARRSRLPGLLPATHLSASTQC
jgi:cell envelope opacity-associated protein A